MASTTTQSKTTSRAILVITGLLVLSALGYFVVRTFSGEEQIQAQKGKIDELNEEVVQLEDKIFEFKSQIESQDMDIATREKMLADQKQELQNLYRKIADADTRDRTYRSRLNEMEGKLKELESQLVRYEEEISLLKQQTEVQAGTIAQLRDSAGALVEQRETYAQQLESTESELNQTRQMAAILRTKDFAFYDVDKRGRAKEKEAFRRRDLNTLRVCFTLMDNSFAQPGPRELYLVWETPDNNPNTNFAEGQSGTFFYEGKEKAYTVSKQVNYTRLAQEICMDYSPPKEFKNQSGVQYVYLYCEGHLIGQSTFNVR